MAVDNQVDPTIGTIRMKGQFDNKDTSLFPNQFVNARLLVDTRAAPTLVPAAAIQRGPDSQFVYVVKADETVEVHSVTVGPTEGEQTVSRKASSRVTWSSPTASTSSSRRQGLRPRPRRPGRRLRSRGPAASIRVLLAPRAGPARATRTTQRRPGSVAQELEPQPPPPRRASAP